MRYTQIHSTLKVVHKDGLHGLNFHTLLFGVVYEVNYIICTAHPSWQIADC